MNEDQAQDPNTPPEVLATLATSNEAEVRYCVAGNPSTPAAVLEALARDEGNFEQFGDGNDFHDYFVYDRALRNPSLPIEALQRLASHNQDYLQELAAKALQERLARQP
jgi:hypothetical protein